MWLIKQALRNSQQQRNLDQLTQARSLITFINANLGKDSQPINDIAGYLPHPNVWRSYVSDRKLKISQAAAIEFLNTFRKFDVSVECTFTDWLEEIESIASGL